jgi:hypothetical protein
MKKVKDIFSYSVGWGSAGVMCSFCKYLKVKEDKVSGEIILCYCALHKLKLDILRNKDGYFSGEYFCKDFSNENPFPQAVEEFNSIKDQLEENVLYEACQKEYLCMTPFDELEKIDT